MFILLTRQPSTEYSSYYNDYAAKRMVHSSILSGSKRFSLLQILQTDYEHTKLLIQWVPGLLTAEKQLGYKADHLPPRGSNGKNQ